MTNEEINRAVALAMGATVTYHKPQWSSAEGWKLRQLAKTVLGQEDRTPSPCWQEDGLYMTEEYAWSKVHNFCTDPAAADLVRLEIERRGWDVDTTSNSIHFTEGRLYHAYVIRPVEGDRGFRGEGHKGISKTSPHHALCIAFLAAHDAIDTDKDRAGDGPERGL